MANPFDAYVASVPPFPRNTLAMQYAVLTEKDWATLDLLVQWHALWAALTGAFQAAPPPGNFRWGGGLHFTGVPVYHEIVPPAHQMRGTLAEARMLLGTFANDVALAATGGLGIGHILRLMTREGPPCRFRIHTRQVYLLLHETTHLAHLQDSVSDESCAWLERRVTVAMSMHARLGADSGFPGGEDVMRFVADHTGAHPHPGPEP